MFTLKQGRLFFFPEATQTTTQQFECRISYVDLMGLFRDMVHSIKSAKYVEYIIFSLWKNVFAVG